MRYLYGRGGNEKIMTVNELRVDNFILFKLHGEDEGKVGQMKRGDFGRFNEKEYHPIPLTPEWLTELGFEDIGPYWQYNGEPGFVLLKEDGVVYIGNPARTYIKTVHHLQNLYYALTEGKELNVKL